MPLVITPGAADADSYASLPQAAAHAVSYGAAWEGEDAAREAALRRATAYLDGEAFVRRYGGARANGRAQALQWPRKGAVDRDVDDVDGLAVEPSGAVDGAEVVNEAARTDRRLHGQPCLWGAHVAFDEPNTCWAPLKR